MNTDIIIIGGGICGLHTAYKLQKAGIDFLLLEARDRLGGRILSNNYDPKLQSDSPQKYDETIAAYDLGPSWFWPSQAKMDTLLNELDLKGSVFSQYGKGNSVFEDQHGNLQKGLFGISMEGAYRLNGGIRQIITALESKIDSKRIIAGSPVTSISYKDGTVVVDIDNKIKDESKQDTIKGNKVVLALPPRLAASNIEFSPALPDARRKELHSYSTWMAGHAKVIAVYDQPFWLEQGLSGDAFSHLGPLREIHDASSRLDDDLNNSGHALFGFVGVPSSYRAGNENQVIEDAIQQLVRIFGEKAASPLHCIMQDWSLEEFTATETDRIENGGHATSSITNYLEPSFNEQLIWSGSESADHRFGHNGLLEGALEASERSLSLLL